MVGPSNAGDDSGYTPLRAGPRCPRCGIAANNSDLCVTCTSKSKHGNFAPAPVSDPTRANKMDSGKWPVWQGFLKYFPRAVIATAMVSEYGKRKYAPDDQVFNSGWRDVPHGLDRYTDADVRHLLQTAITECGPYDKESELAHLAHKAWNAMAELERAIVDGVVEIRRGVDIVDGKPVPGTSQKVML